MKALQCGQRRDSCLLMRGIPPNGALLMKLPLRIHFPGEKRFHEFIANIIYSAKIFRKFANGNMQDSKNCFKEYSEAKGNGRQPLLFQYIFVYFIRIWGSAYSIAVHCIVCVLKEKRKFKMNFKPQNSLQVWLKCEIIYTQCDHEQISQRDRWCDPAEFTT